MIKKLVLFVSLTGVFLCTASCGHKELPSMGDYSVQVFNDTHVRFAPDVYPAAFNAVAVYIRNVPSGNTKPCLCLVLICRTRKMS